MDGYERSQRSGDSDEDEDIHAGNIETGDREIGVTMELLEGMGKVPETVESLTSDVTLGQSRHRREGNWSWLRNSIYADSELEQVLIDDSEAGEEDEAMDGGESEQVSLSHTYRLDEGTTQFGEEEKGDVNEETNSECLIACRCGRPYPLC
jgi:hypothetical protein